MRILGLLTLAILLPAFAHAAVAISEVMYDISGTDTGREWVEIKNTGDSAIDAGGFKFFEANTNHVLTLVSGTGVLQSGGFAVIADDSAKFKIDWPSYSGILFDSSFSLSNAGESLAIKDDVLNILDSISYNPSLGAAGDGNSLQLVNGSWIAAAPTPGAANADNSTSSPDTSSDATSTTNTTTSVTTSSSSGSATTPKSPPSALTVEAGVNRDAVMKVPLHLFARAMVKGGGVDPSARITWGFGDGSSAEGTTVEKAYLYAGSYLVVVTATDGQAIGRDEFIVTVRPAQVRILEVPDTGVMIINDMNERLDISGWALFADRVSFRIPDGTVILPKASVILPSTVTKLPTAPEVTLAYPNGGVAARYAVSPEPITTTASVSKPNAQPSSSVASYEQVQKVEPIISVVENVPEYEEAVSAPAVANELAAVGAVLLANETAPAATARTAGIFKSPWTLSFLGVVILAGVAFIFL